MEETNTKTPNLLFLIAGAIISFLLWDTLFIYPIKIFVVLLHEISHGIMAILTGGEIVKIEIDQNIGGACYTTGGSPFIVASSGYIGSIILGGVVFLNSNKTRSIKILGYIISFFMLIICIAFIRNVFGFVFGFLFGIGLIILTKYAPEVITRYFLKFIGLVSCFYVLFDIKEDLFTTQYRGSDADIIASLTGISSIFWGILWFIISLICFILFMRKSIKLS